MIRPQKRNKKKKKHIKTNEISGQSAILEVPTRASPGSGIVIYWVGFLNCSHWLNYFRADCHVGGLDFLNFQEIYLSLPQK